MSHDQQRGERLDEMQQQFDRFLEHLRQLKSQSQAILATSQTRPLVDVFETDRCIVVIAELAGVRQDELEVSVHQRKLRIRGFRRPWHGEAPRVSHQMEIDFGPFDRVVTLPAEVDPDSATASWDNGMLQVTFNKLAPRVRRVPIRTTEIR